MCPQKSTIAAFACITRLVVVLVQFVANLLIPDHDAGVFICQKTNLTRTVLDETVTVLLGGFVRWDGQYFMHIAKYGYSYENTLAFFPLYPLIVRAIATAGSHFILFLNEDSVLLLTFTLLNVYLFVKASITLYDLTCVVLNEGLAYKAAILFCINPATIFFVAPYTECLFSYLTFKCMLNCVIMYDKKSVNADKRLSFKSIIDVIIPLDLSTCVRSNGVLNIGFVAYFMTQYYVKHCRLLKSFKNQIMYSIQFGLLLLIIVSVCLAPFVFVQIYHYYQFCTNFNHNLPDFLVDFARHENYVLPGMISKYKQRWCFDRIPLAYSYVQDHYWNVGFLRYFEIKQVPNFILALPVVYIICINSVRFFELHKEYCINLGMFRFKFASFQNLIRLKGRSCFKQEMFVFIVHAVFLTVFSVLCIHVQVTTRMICSASPVLYWFAAYYFRQGKELDGSLINVFVFHKNLNKQGQYVLYYFLSYCFVGTVLFVNFLPWT